MSIFAKRYVLLQELGQGGMGIVYRALDRISGNIVALKQVLTPPSQLMFGSMNDYEEERIALTREFQSLASLRHPHVIRVLDYGFDVNPHSASTERYPYFTMDFLQQPRSILDAGRGLTVEGKVYLIIQMLQAVAYLHRRRLLHRDLKPHNVMVVDEYVYVLDFGLAVDYEQARGTVGTLPYMAPEVLQGKGADKPSDLYAVGVMAYELLVGHHPFDTRSMAQLVQQVLHTNPDFEPLETIQFTRTRSTDEIPLDDNDVKTVILQPDDAVDPHDPSTVDDATPPPFDKRITQTNIRVAEFVSAGGYLSSIVQRLLAKDPRQRYQDAVDVIRDLNRVLDVPVPIETTEIREAYLQAASFVGRKEPFDQLLYGLYNVMAGNGSAWLIGGESGVGKSRLVNELRIRALVEGALVFIGQAVAEGGLPYQMWRAMVRRMASTTDLEPLEASVLKMLVPDVGSMVDFPVTEAPELQGREAQQRLFDIIIGLFRKQIFPVVIILEDLHWGAENLDVVRALNVLVKEGKLMMVGTFRDDEAPNLPDQLPELQLLPLKRLNHTGVADLVEAMLGPASKRPGLVDFLHTQTEGNVFFLVEVVRALAESAGNLYLIEDMDLPESVITSGVRQIINRRLNQVSGAALHLLQFAALAGRQLQMPLLRHWIQDWPDFDLKAWLAQCTHASILEAQEDYWRFAHDKLREGAIATIDPTERINRYRQVAEVIETVYDDPSVHALNLTRLWHEVGDTRKEAHYAEIAGSQQFQISAYREAIRLFDRALDLVQTKAEGDTRVTRANLMRQIGTAYERINDYPTATRYLDISLALARELDDKLTIAQALIGLNQVARMLGQFPNARAYLQEALTLSRDLNDDRMIATALNDLCVIEWLQGEYESANELGAEVLDIARRINNPALIATILRNLGNIAAIQQDSAASRQYLGEAVYLFEQIGDRDSHAKAVVVLGGIEREAGNLDKAKQYFQDSLSFFNSIGALGLATIPLISLAWIELDLGDFALSKSYLRQGLNHAKATGTILYILMGLRVVAKLLHKLQEYHKSVEILSAILVHPAYTPEESEPIQDMLDVAQKCLGKEDYEYARLTGSKADIMALLDELLSEAKAYLS
ncbi:MAG: tetratricopeptide repeat protein [Anaerolineales bacterium]|nr:tetratricopeptide repeat protein [Anaerolineales bacterium]